MTLRKKIQMTCITCITYTDPAAAWRFALVVSGSKARQMPGIGAATLGAWRFALVGNQMDQMILLFPVAILGAGRFARMVTGWNRRSG